MNLKHKYNLIGIHRVRYTIQIHTYKSAQSLEIKVKDYCKSIFFSNT